MKISLIPDNEILLNEETDLLGTSPYVEIVCNTINNNEGKLTLGIFGAWGSGKSSIVKSVIQKFESKQERYFSFYYDAWKFNDDSFKRNFILELVTKLKIDDKYFQEKLYNSIESDEIVGSALGYDWLFKVLIYSSAALPIITLLDSFLKEGITDIRAYYNDN